MTSLTSFHPFLLFVFFVHFVDEFIMTEREFAIAVIQQLQDAGHQALWAGGCVRDELLGLVPKDYDVATDARPEEVQQLFRRTLAIGASFGVVEVLGPRQNGQYLKVQVATFRTDGGYSDGRRPDQVVFAVVTDGLENSSCEWTRDKVMAAVKERSDAGWQFSFLGANQDAIKEGSDLGVDAARAMTYSAAPQAVAAAMSSLSDSVKRVKTGKDRILSFTDEERRRSRG